jgi:hypothetical protein
VVRGIAELRSGERLEVGRVRRAGAGRPRLTESDEFAGLIWPQCDGGKASQRRNR